MSEILKKENQVLSDLSNVKIEIIKGISAIPNVKESEKQLFKMLGYVEGLLDYSKSI